MKHSAHPVFANGRRRKTSGTAWAGSKDTPPFPKKSLSQHFLRSAAVRDEILASINADPEDVVVEIGAGMGALTKGLARNVSHVVAVEVDRELAAFLEKTIAPLSNVNVLCGSILDLDLRRVATEFGRERLVVVGNLPYHLTTKVILHLIDHGSVILRAVVMVQKEYADRLLASPGGRDYGAITLRTAYSAEVSRVLDVPASAFRPRPAVDSTVLSLAFRAAPPVEVEDEEFLFKVIRSTFNQRRKMLVNPLSSLSGLKKEEVKAVCRSVEVEPDRRPETLGLEEFARLADALRSNE